MPCSHAPGKYSDQSARVALPHYFRLLDGQERARFLSCSSLGEKVAEARAMRTSCRFCEHRCGVDRTNAETGFCRVLEPRISSQFMPRRAGNSDLEVGEEAAANPALRHETPHFSAGLFIHVGEEPELVPSHTVFFSGCPFTCCFCQNFDISQHAERGHCIRAGDLAKSIESTAAINVNWVGGDPTPNIDYVLEVLTHVTRSIPQIWNSNMYLTQEAMNLLDGVVDCYLTDFKYASNECGKLSGVDDYFDVICRNHLVAERQDADLIVRHLVLPGHVDCCTKPVLDRVAENLSRPRVNVMAQYHPAWNAHEHPNLHRRIDSNEYAEARNYAEELGLSLTR